MHDMILFKSMKKKSACEFHIKFQLQIFNSKSIHRKSIFERNLSG